MNIIISYNSNMPKTKYLQFDSPQQSLKGAVYISDHYYGKQRKNSTENKSKIGNVYSGIGGLGGGAVDKMNSGPFPVKF